MRENGTAPETAGNGNTVTKSAHMMALEKVVRMAAFLALSLVDTVICVIMFFYTFYFDKTPPLALYQVESNPVVGPLFVGATIGIAHAAIVLIFFRKLLPEFLVMMVSACGLAVLYEKNESGGFISWHWFEGLGLSCLLGLAFFVAATGAFYVLGLMKKPRIKPLTFGSAFLALLLAIPASCVWDLATNLFLGMPSLPLANAAWFLGKGVLTGFACAFAWRSALVRRDANYWLEHALLLVAAILLSYVHNLLEYYKISGGFPGMTQLIAAALFAALAVPLSLRHKRRKAAAKAEAENWLDARIASAGEGVDVLADLAGGPMVSVGSPATLAAVKDCLRGARWLPKAKFLKEGDKTAPDTRLDLGGNVAENGMFWFRSPGTGREQAFVLAEKDWERLADLAAAVKADGTGETGAAGAGDSSGTGAAGPGDSGEAAPGPGGDGAEG